MPQTDNDAIANNVGQDKPAHDVVVIYDNSHGTYRGLDHSSLTKAGEHRQISAPFTLGGEK